MLCAGVLGLSKLMNSIADNISAVQQRVQHALRGAGRNSDSVQLLAVSKTQPVAAIRAAERAGLRAFGENYLQEAEQKIAQLQSPGAPLQWHFIGPLQANKTRRAAELFDWVHSVDRLKIAQRLAAQRPAGLAPLNICLQVNIDDEPSKAGLRPAELAEVAAAVATLPGIRLRGLMAIPKPRAAVEQQRAPFAALRALRDSLNKQLTALQQQPMDTLSMGMSGDLEAAIAEGATIVRVGSDIFGARAPLR